MMYMGGIYLFLTLNRERDYNEEFEYLLVGKDALRTGDQQRHYPGLTSKFNVACCVEAVVCPHACIHAVKTDPLM